MSPLFPYTTLFRSARLFGCSVGFFLGLITVLFTARDRQKACYDCDRRQPHRPVSVQPSVPCGTAFPSALIHFFLPQFYLHSFAPVLTCVLNLNQSAF